MYLSAYESKNIKAIGEWKPGLKYNSSCVLENRDLQSACCDDSVRKIHFEFYNKSIDNSENVLKTFLAKVQGKNVVLLGDSLQRNFFAAIAELFHIGK